MQVPLEWLKQLVPITESAQEIATRLTMGGLEVEGIETEQCEERPLVPVLDTYITPNRGDCLSILGVAREAAALYNVPLTHSNGTVSRSVGSDLDGIHVTIEAPDLCPRYAARIVRNVKIGPSPGWMQARLKSAGQRPISNVVDVTNYVMLELGQPLHAFDLDKIEGKRIIVRRARTGEELTTLDGAERSLTPEILVIADANRPIAAAGLMGGADSEVSETTTDILLEAAHFNPLSVRRASRILSLRSEASYRFERVVDPNGVVRALDRACELLMEMGNALPTPGVIDVYPNPVVPVHLQIRPDRASFLLGMGITPQIAVECLTRLGFEVQEAGEYITALIPTFRTDIRIEEDLVEEIGRIYGYENIPETLPDGAASSGGDSEEGSFLTKIRSSLADSGLIEVVNHSLSGPSLFDSEEDDSRRVRVRNALSSEVSMLRRSLLPGILETAKRNAAHGQTAMHLFEVGRVWQITGDNTGDSVPKEYSAAAGFMSGTLTPPGWMRTGGDEAADYYTVRGVVEQLLRLLRIEESEFLPPANSAQIPQFHPGRTAILSLSKQYPAAGVVGELHPRLASTLGLKDRIYLFEISLEALDYTAPKGPPRYASLSRYPSVTRDLAPRVHQSVRYAEVESTVLSVDSPILESLRLTDVFAGEPLSEGIKSYTLSLVFRSASRTLIDSEIQDAVDIIRARLMERCSAEFAG